MTEVEQLSEMARELLTESGYLNAMARLYSDLSSRELTRDQTSALIGARRCLESFAETRLTRIERKEHKELLEEMAQVREAMKAQEGSSVGLTAEQVQLPQKASPKHVGGPRK